MAFNHLQVLGWSSKWWPNNFQISLSSSFFELLQEAQEDLKRSGGYYIDYQPQTMNYWGEIPEKYHIFALFDSPKMGNLVTPDLSIRFPSPISQGGKTKMSWLDFWFCIQMSTPKRLGKNKSRQRLIEYMLNISHVYSMSWMYPPHPGCWLLTTRMTKKTFLGSGYLTQLHPGSGVDP